MNTLQELRIEKLIAASPDKVFDAFTNTKQLSEWFTSMAEVDLRVGGKYANADGDCGEYLEITPSKKIVFTWDNPGHCPGTEVAISFEPKGNQSCCILLVHSKLTSQEHIRDMESGWSWALDNVKLWLETGRKVGYEEWLANRA